MAFTVALPKLEEAVARLSRWLPTL